MQDAYVCIGLDGQIREWNPAFGAITGYSDAELCNLSLHALIPKKWQNQMATVIEQTLRKGYSDVFEREYIRKEGTVIPVEVRAFLLRSDSQKPEGIWAIVRDISVRKRQEQALRLANRKLQLMNMVAWHDIQNKITGLRGYIGLTKGLVTDKKVNDFLNAEEAILQVIHQQIAYTREYQEIGEKPHRWMMVDNLIRTARMGLKVAPISLSVDVGDLEIYGDPVIVKVFFHIIENSLRDGANVTRISIYCTESDECVRLIYEDDGVGIPDAKKQDLFAKNFGKTEGFEMFFAHDALEISGMGIIESGVPGKGVRFEITIPSDLYRFGARAHP